MRRKPVWMQDAPARAHSGKLLRIRTGSRSRCNRRARRSGAQFFSEEPLEPDHVLLGIAEHIGGELARVIQHKRREKSFRPPATSSSTSPSTIRCSPAWRTGRCSRTASSTLSRTRHRHQPPGGRPVHGPRRLQADQRRVRSCRRRRGPNRDRRARSSASFARQRTPPPASGATNSPCCSKTSRSKEERLRSLPRVTEALATPFRLEAYPTT